MKSIILACAAGMSTSIVVSKMKKEAENRGLNLNIYAIPEGSLEEELDATSDEVLAILLGPQVRFMKEKAKKLGEPKGIAVDVMDTMLYGTANGAKILDHALRISNQQ